MGSEGTATPVTRFHITGFKKFHGVAKNPTEVIVSRLPDFMKERGGLPDGCSLESCTVLETAGKGALQTLLDLLDRAAAGHSPGSLPSSSHRKLGDFISAHDPVEAPAAPPSPQERLIWVHLGVNSGATKFAIERRAVNEATFRCPDEMGWQPQRLPIVPEDGPISSVRETNFAAVDVVCSLSKKGYEVTVSDDAGRFVCNYVYYQSLRHSAANDAQCLFVHVPLFTKIEEEIQMQFVASLLEVLATAE